MIPDPERDEPLEFTPAFAVVLTLGATFLQFALLLTLAGATGRASLAVLGIASIVSFGAMFALGVQRIPAPPSAALGLLRAPSRAWTAALLLLPSVLVVSELDNLLQVFAPRPDQLADSGDPPGGLAALELVIALVVVLPAIEELFFRGLIQPRISERLGPVLGVLVTAMLAGSAALALGGPWQLQRSFSLGLVLGILRESSRSLVPCLVLHAAFGAVTVLATYQLFGIGGFDDLSVAHTPLAWLVLAAIATGAGLRICQSLWPGAAVPGEEPRTDR